MSETSDASSQLPIPFFQVLLEEDLALHDPALLKEVSWERTLNSENAWVFHADQLSDSLRQLAPPNRERAFREFANRLRELLSQNAGEKDESVTEDTLVNLLNELVKSSPGLCHCPKFPIDLLQGDGAAYAKLRLSDPERLLVNRLLLEDLFSAELKRIYDIRLARVHAGIHARAKEAAPQKRKRQTALCLSGGGIRSATFALGILQGISRRDWLPEIDYLSTVSGGGYVGSWLSSWIHHARNSAEVFAALKSDRAASPTEPEPKPVRYLRMFSNYLTPKLGAFSADTWTLIGTYLRNLFVNWLVFVPLLLALFGIPRAYLSLLRTQPPPGLFWTLLLLGALGAACSLAYATVNRPTVQPALPAGAFWSTRRKQGDFLLWGLLPLVASGFCLTTCWFWLRQRILSNDLLVLASAARRQPEWAAPQRVYRLSAPMAVLCWRRRAFALGRVVVRAMLAAPFSGVGVCHRTAHRRARWPFPLDRSPAQLPGRRGHVPI